MMRFLKRKFIRENLEIDQTGTVNEDGSVDIQLAAILPNEESRSRDINVAETEEGDIAITTAFESGAVRTTTVSEDADDGGVDVAVAVTGPEGQTTTRYFELDLTEEGLLSITVTTTKPDGTSFTNAKEGDLARFLGEEDAALAVKEVAETFLDFYGVDTGVPELIGLLGGEAASLEVGM